MKAGRKLEDLVAKHVMGWTVHQDRGASSYVDADGMPHNPVKFSRSITAAWLVVERMRARGYRYRVNDYGPNLPHCASFFNAQENGAIIHGDTAPHAICLAALAALGEPPL